MGVWCRVQALQGRNITTYGDGSQTRSFCYVDDLIDGMLWMMSTTANVTGPINIGNPSEFTIRELAELVIELTASNSKLDFQPLTSDDPRQRQDESHPRLGAEDPAARRAGEDHHLLR